MNNVSFRIIEKKINSCNRWQVVMMHGNNKFDLLKNKYIYKTRLEALETRQEFNDIYNT